MLDAILCYNDEDIVWSWSRDEDAAVMANARPGRTVRLSRLL